ncbi:MAG: pentapeptide repeat-containing protein [Planctomycetota bacterium]|jgi:uncharacterized protein YjbI with pentapeptide repeats|nr:pentapeptide repeat-containing protein [Planctomycetota bacterium]
MANPGHVEIVKTGAEALAKWQRSHRWPQCLDLRDVNLCGIKLEDADLRGVDFRNANLQNVTLNRCRLIGTRMDKADLKGASLAGSTLRCSTLAGANLEGADLTSIKASGVDFRRTRLSGAALDLSQLVEANLREADLTGVSLARVTLTRASLQNAKLDGIRLYATETTEWHIAGVCCTHFFVGASVEPDLFHWKRVPAEGELRPGEFEDRFKSRPTIEFMFENGMPTLAPAVLDQAIADANKQMPSAGLRLLEITGRGMLPRAIIEIADRVSKEDVLKLVSAFYEQRMDQLRAELVEVRGHHKSLLQAVSDRMLLPALLRTDARLPAETLAEMFGVDREALRKRLERTREKRALDSEFFVEVANRGTRKPQYLYNPARVLPIAEDLKRKASAKRPPKKK